MGLLKCVKTGDTCALEPEHLVGRSPRANLQLNASYVSAQHAAIRWLGDAWEVKDLGSRNGTLLDGKPIGAGLTVELRAGATLAFGRAEQEWLLVDDSAPLPILISEDEPGTTVAVDSEVVALPSQDDPWATVFRRNDGLWHLEKEEVVTPLVAGQTFEVRGQRWRFSCPSRIADTSTVDFPELIARRMSALRLLLRVSSNEEHVELYARRGVEDVDLGSRSHHYLLLHLARQRLDDLRQGVVDGEAGWVYRDALLSALKIDREYLNISIFRIRKQFEGAGFHDAVNIVERRPDTQQLRIGTPLIDIEPT